MFFLEELSKQHRCSRHQKDTTDTIANFAASRSLDHPRDGEQTIIIRKPGTPGQEQVPAVALHGHIDMVCKIAPGIAHDFSPQGVTLIVDGHRIRAKGMTLGADNGLGISCLLAFWRCATPRTSRIRRWNA